MARPDESSSYWDCGRCRKNGKQVRMAYKTTEVRGDNSAFGIIRQEYEIYECPECHLQFYYRERDE